MANIDQVVEVQISRDTVALDEADFNTLLFVSNEQVFPETSRKYYSADQLITDGFDATGAAHAAALAYFSQNPSPTQMIIGRHVASTQVLVIADEDIKNYQTYSVTVSNGTDAAVTISHTTDGTAEDDLAAARTAITAALDAAMTASAPFSAIVGHALATDKITISTIIQSDTIQLSNVVIESGTYETMAVMLNAQMAYDNLWYTLAMYSHTETDVLAMAALIEAQYKIFVTSTPKAESKVVIAANASAATDDIPGKLKELNYDRTGCFFSDESDSKYFEVAVAGKKLTSVPGATTWMYTVLKGQSVDNLSVSESSILRGKHCNTFEDFAGTDMVREGVVSSGEFIDIMRGSDELRNRIQIAVFRALVIAANGGSKIALTDEGVGQLTAIVETELRRSAESGFLKLLVATKDAAGQVQQVAGFKVEASLVSSLTSNQRASRQAPDIRFAASLAGAVHKVVIRGNLTV